jgi:hypothetical protein
LECEKEYENENDGGGLGLERGDGIGFGVFLDAIGGDIDQADQHGTIDFNHAQNAMDS